MSVCLTRFFFVRSDDFVAVRNLEGKRDCMWQGKADWSKMRRSWFALKCDIRGVKDILSDDMDVVTDVLRGMPILLGNVLPFSY